MSRKDDFFKSDFVGSERRGYHHGNLREALIGAARRLVAERGPAGFTLADAAKLAGVTAAAPYRHFADRDALMEELAARGFAMFGERLLKAWDLGRPDTVKAMHRMGTAYLGFARDEPGLYSAMFGSVRTLEAPNAGAAADRALDVLFQASAAILRDHGAPVTGARDLAFQVWSLSHGIAMLTVAGHLAPRSGCDPEGIMDSAASALVEMAIRRAIARRAGARRHAGQSTHALKSA